MLPDVMNRERQTRLHIFVQYAMQIHHAIALPNTENYLGNLQRFFVSLSWDTDNFPGDRRLIYYLCVR